MKEYKIYVNLSENATLNFENFAKEIAEKINNDAELLERTKSVNRNFVERLKTMLENEENIDCFGAMALRAIRETPRYTYIKNLEHNGKKYEAKIDHLSRRFELQEVK